MTTPSFDPQWESIYGEGHQLNRYPWDAVVSFVFSNAPSKKQRSATRILEIGCGSGSNLWFAAREGFQVAGVDGSASAIAYAKKRLSSEGLSGDLQVADFTKLPFPDESFDLAIDRCSLTCCGRSAAQRAVDEVFRVLHPGGRFFCNPYSDTHSSYRSSEPGDDDLRYNIVGGTLVGIGRICFYSNADLEKLFARWKIRNLRHLELREDTQAGSETHSEWRIIAEKPL